MIELLVLVLIGCILGVLTGITPGIHVNMVCLLGFILYNGLGLTSTQFAVAMISMAVTHTFLDFIPAIFIGVPEEQTALSVLPAHRMVLEGNAYEAVKITGYGSIIGLFFATASIPAALYFVPKIYFLLRGVIVYVLIIAVAYLIFREKTWKKRLWAVTIFTLAGWLGFVAFNQKIISENLILFPLFTGLFGLSTIIYSLRQENTFIPQKEYAIVDVDKNFVTSGFLGALGGMLVGILPAMSPSQVGIILTRFYKESTRNFLVAVSAINTSDAIYSFIALYTIRNPRSGVATILGKIIDLDYNTLLLFLGVIMFTAPIALALHLKIGRIALKFSRKINFRNLNIAAFAIVVFLVYYLTGFWGFLFAITATALGLLPIQTGVSRTHSMGVLILPTIIYFL